jgi:hypothetical protein
MIRFTTLTLALSALGFGPAAAQVRPEPKTDDITPKLLGTWEGPYQSEQAPPGGLKLVIAKEGAAWKVTLAVVSDQPIDAAEVRDFKVEGNEITWVQDIMDMQCKSLARLTAGNTLTGGSECSQAGTVSITATFVLLKQ